MYSSSRNELATETVIWSIKNFSRISPRAGFSIDSSIIHGNHARKTWKFTLFPVDANYVDAYFEKAYLMFDPAIYNYLISIEGTHGNRVESFECNSMDLKHFSIRLDKCIRRESIEKLLKGSLTVRCEITEASQKSYLRTIISDFENLSSDLSALYNCPMYYDLTVRLQNFEFHLHTSVLYARCRLFSQLFGYPSFYEMPKIIEMKDLSPDLFRQLTYYLYSGKLEDCNFSLELMMYARQLKLESLMQSFYEKVQEYHRNTEIATQALTITWNLKETRFQENDAVPFVQIFKLECCMTHLAVRMGTSEHCNEKYIDISFKVFMDTLHKPTSLICMMTLFSNGKVHAYKKDSCNIYEEEEWHFPPFVKLSDIPEGNETHVRSPDIYLTAEISLSDGCIAYSNLHTQTRLITYSPAVIYPERLGSDMRCILSSNAQSQFKNHDISLKSVDNCYLDAHKAILWARWPAIRDTMKNNSTCLPLNYYAEEIQTLLDYIYTGFAPSIYYKSADKLLKADAMLECPPPIVNKCRYLLHK